MCSISSSITLAQLPLSAATRTQCTQNTPIPQSSILLWRRAKKINKRIKKRPCAGGEKCQRSHLSLLLLLYHHDYLSRCIEMLHSEGCIRNKTWCHCFALDVMQTRHLVAVVHVKEWAGEGLKKKGLWLMLCECVNGKQAAWSTKASSGRLRSLHACGSATTCSDWVWFQPVFPNSSPSPTFPQSST